VNPEQDFWLHRRWKSQPAKRGHKPDEPKRAA
jgi:lauroyl/myristoyl acyltransferase